LIEMKDAQRLVDPEPVLGDELLTLGRWISGYYCSPLARSFAPCCRWR